MTSRAAIYARQSLDRSGEGTAVSRQLSECRELAERNGWEVVEVYQDNDRSATSGKVRPEWMRLLADLKAGRHDVLIAWHTDRLYRRLRDLVDLVEIAQDRTLKIATVRSSDLDLSTPAGRMMAGLLGSVASYEGEQKAARQIAANRQRAQAGVVLWTRRPFGFDRDGRDVYVVEIEADELRQAAKAVLAGETTASVARDMNARNVTTTVGKPWSVTSVRRALLNPRLVGRVVYRGEDFGDGGPQILDAETFDRVGALLRDPSRKMAPPSTELKWLLSGLVRCGNDDEPMWATPSPSGRMIYRCRRCYMGRGLEDVDEVVLGIVSERLSRSDAASLFSPDTDLDVLRERAVEIRERRDGLAGLLADGLLGAEAVRAQATKLAAELDDVERELEHAVAATPLARLAIAVDVRTSLMDLPVRTLRTVIDTLAIVRVLPAGKGVRFDPDQVLIEWRQA
ncbi:recombinase family protein [Phycicoccus avicenniae]|uniref:recombinase family protein n=1 Tax=Phycicoccus avicenniae TaxID=2828860 RepID=UPI003D297F52